MPRPSKPLALVEGHRTKAEIKARAEAESSLATGEAWKEWPEVKSNPVAHNLFKRLTKLFQKIEKNDALSEPIINRYCLLQAECAVFEEDAKRLRGRLDELEDRKDELEFAEYMNLAVAIQKQIISNDSNLQKRRKMLLDIERETCMTLKAQLASIPKKPQEQPVANKFSKFKVVQ